MASATHSTALSYERAMSTRTKAFRLMTQSHRKVQKIPELGRICFSSWLSRNAIDKRGKCNADLSRCNLSNSAQKLETFPTSNLENGLRSRQLHITNCLNSVEEHKPVSIGGDITQTDSSVSGNSIRKTFLDFYASRGHTILPSSSLVPDDPTVLLTIAGMLQFKPVFLGQVPRKVPRATTSQKCVRTNDVENVGRTKRHHTFFEMLGNFSFGDYFKAEACQWAWELATKEYKIPVERVWISVFENDDEAFEIWEKKIGVSPSRIQRMGADDNFWTSGPTGPCGPCSEMYFDFFPELGTEGADLGDDSRFIEFYNLVFMENNRLEDGSLEELKQKNIDTGLGLERMAQILQQVPNNYETDLIFPIVEVAAKLAGIDYHKSDEKTKTQLKVIGDHSRAVVYLISDGVNPSNIGRGYIVRRLIRRAVRMGKLLGIASPTGGAFLPIIAKQVVAMSGPIDPEVSKRQKKIFEELEREEIKFVQTLERGDKMLSDLIVGAKAAAIQASERGQTACPALSGTDVFTLYDTYGFPVEITKEVAEEQGISVDIAGFEAEMEKQRKRAQAAHTAVKLTAGSTISDVASKLKDTEFLGYASLVAESTISALVSDTNCVDEVSAVDGNEKVEVFVDRSPFYAEGGGQIGDVGIFECFDSEGIQTGVFRVNDTQKIGSGVFVHGGTILRGKISVGDSVLASVDEGLRRRAQAHHTATHLLQSALKKVIGEEIGQAGSLVSFDKLRFDFNCPRPINGEEIVAIEALVNSWIDESVPLESDVMAIADAKARGATAMFGEKYGEEVRVINVPGISMELCGGTHVSNTAEIRGFKVISESGIASGVRRIEAVAGPEAIQYLVKRDSVLATVASQLKVKVDDIPARVAGLQDDLRSARQEIIELRGQVALSKAQSLADSAVTVGPSFTKVLVSELEGVDPESLKLLAERIVSLIGDPSAVVLGSVSDQKVSIVAAFSPQAVKLGLQAGKFVGSVAKLCGGGGGGRPNFAQAGGKLPEKLPEAMQKAKADLEAALAS